MNTKSMMYALALSTCMMSALPAHADEDLSPRGGPVLNDGSFNYQGFLQFDGEPANGDFYFRFRFYDSIVGGSEISPLYSEIGPITATDGLFNCNILMGDNTLDALSFWRIFGDQEKYLNIEVGQIAGTYTTLSPRVLVGSSAHAMHSRFAKSLTFPYVDTYQDPNGDPETMMSLTNVFEGIVLDLQSETVSDTPTLLAHTDDQYNLFFDNGLISANGVDKEVGVMGATGRFSILGLGVSDLSNNRAAVLGEVRSEANPGVIAVWALNQASGNDAALGTEEYSGDFNRDVIVRQDLRVQQNPTRDYAFNNPSPIGPLAYASISTAGNVNSGTANLSCTWDAINSRYDISVTGETMSFASHIVSVTIVDSSEPRIATFNTGAGNVRVKIWDLNSGNVAVQDNFSIVIYDPDSTTLANTPIPHGVDADKYTEQHSVPLIHSQPRHEPVEPFENYGSGTGE